MNKCILLPCYAKDLERDSRTAGQLGPFVKVEIGKVRLSLYISSKSSNKVSIFTGTVFIFISILIFFN